MGKVPQTFSSAAMLTEGFSIAPALLLNLIPALPFTCTTHLLVQLLWEWPQNKTREQHRAVAPSFSSACAPRNSYRTRWTRLVTSRMNRNILRKHYCWIQLMEKLLKYWQISKKTFENWCFKFPCIGLSSFLSLLRNPFFPSFTSTAKSTLISLTKQLYAYMTWI